MPAGRPQIRRTEEEARDAQRLSKLRYARRVRSRKRAAIPGDTTSIPTQGLEVARAPCPAMPLSLSPPRLDPRPHSDPTALPWLADLELLHHLTTHTCYTLSDRHPSQKIWQTTVPQEAVSHSFLMRGLLAVSALHLAHLRPHQARQYEVKAMVHQDAAFASFQDMITDVTASNCNAILAFSTVLVVVTVFSPRGPSGPVFLDSMEKTTTWMRSVRGVKPLLLPVWNELSGGSLACLLNTGVWATTVEPPEDAGLHLAALLQLWNQPGGLPEVRDACLAAVEALRGSFACMAVSLKDPTTSNLPTAMVWPCSVSSIYLTALEQRHPKAMIILAYYTLILQNLEDYWWFSKEPAWILMFAYRLLDESMRPWLEWPLRALKLKEEVKALEVG